ncbi:MAG: peptidoglycan DD-metalloendopeptidase family protein [Candidatus Sericytochromatia bacterium]|nr:peptidoglycan DD-metalloendopeptidase family protein [Candidatus Sericytochromatia bacterium]
MPPRRPRPLQGRLAARSKASPEQQLAWRPIMAGLLAFGLTLALVWGLSWALIVRPYQLRQLSQTHSTEPTSSAMTEVLRSTEGQTGPVTLRASPTRILLDERTQPRAELLALAPDELSRPTRLHCAPPFVYFLARGQLYRADVSPWLEQARTRRGPQNAPARLLAEPLMPNREHRLEDGTPIQALQDLMSLTIPDPAPDAADSGAVPAPALLLLDRANQLFQLDPQQGQWRHLSDAPFSLPPPADQSESHPVALAPWGGRAYALDYQRNQIWRYADGAFSAYFARQSRSLQKAIDLHVDGDIYVLLRQGEIWRYRNGQQDKQALFKLAELPWPHAARPISLRALRGDAAHLYVLDAGQRRILQLAKADGQLLREWVLTGEVPEWERLSDLTFCQGQMLALAGNELLRLPAETALQNADLPPLPPLPAFLQGLTHPIPGAEVADNPAVFPGARRLYRFGIHEGLDIFDRQQPATGGRQVRMGTPVLAMADGEVLRVDQDFAEPSPADYEALIDTTRRQGQTTRTQENMLRGRQVWLRHANGLVSIYAHLSKVSQTLKPGQQVVQGQVIGQVGNSGTRAAVYSQPEDPHLHLELWLHDPDSPVGTYLGKGLHIEETLQLWQRILAEESRGTP